MHAGTLARAGGRCLSLEIGTFGGQLRHGAWSYTHTICNENVAQEFTFLQYMIYGDILIYYWKTTLSNTGTPTWFWKSD